MKIAGYDIGVCSWSLGPRDMAELVERVRTLGLEHIQLALAPLTAVDDKRRTEELDVLRSSGITITAGMFSFPGEDYSTIAVIRRTGGYAPDADWPIRRKLTQQFVAIAAQLGLKANTTHIGFVPPSSDPNYDVMVARVGEIAGMLEQDGMNLMLETGQESASELLQFLNDLGRRNIRVNFDPANMILYGAGDPIEAIGILNRHIGHVHVKDAVLSDQPRTTWGREVPFGQGQVNPVAFLKALRHINYAGPLSVEAEMRGPNRLSNVRTAIEALQTAAVSL